MAAESLGNRYQYPGNSDTRATGAKYAQAIVAQWTAAMTRIQPTKLESHGTKYEPIILSMGWTADLYRSVTFSIAPGRRISAIVGPRGATDAEVRDAVRALVAHINT